jgi:hypothetical protein
VEETLAHPKTLQDALVSDSAARTAFQADPVALLASYGIKLTPDQSAGLAMQRGAATEATGIAPNGIAPSGIAPSGISPNGIAPSAGIMPISNSGIGHGIMPISNAALTGIRVGA